MIQATLISTVLAIVTFSAFSGALNCGFVSFDDPFYVYSNPYVKQGVTWNSVTWAFSAFEQGNWHPLTWLSHMLDAELYGPNPQGHHLTSLCIHTLNSLLCFWLFFLLTGRRWTSGLIALFFAIHPLRAESVVWISERKDVLCAFFGFLSLITYTYYVKKKRIAYYVCAFVFLLLGLLSKSMIVTWPFVFLLLDYWPFKRFEKGILRLETIQDAPQYSLRYLIKEKIPFFILIVLFSILAYWSQSGEEAVRPFQEIPLQVRLENITISYVRYLGKILAPSSLAVFYPITLSRYILFKSLGCFLLLAVVTFGVFRLRFKKPYLLTGWFWYLGTLVPIIGIVHIGFQAMADRYTYLPCLGILLMLIPLGADISTKHRLLKTLLISASGLAAAFLILFSWIQTSYWTNSLTLYQHASEVTGTNPIVWLNYGGALEAQGQYDRALKEYQKVIDLYPNSPDPWLSIAGVYLKMKQPEQAEQYLAKANQLFGDKYPEILKMRSQACLALGKPAQAAEYLSKAIETADRQGLTTLKEELLEFQKEMQTQH